MAPDGTDVVPLTTDAGPDVVIDQPVASPDGRFLAWVEIRSGQPSLVTAARSGQRLQSVPMGIVPFFLQWDPTSTNIAYLGNAQTGIGMGVVENAATAPDDVAVGGGSPFYLSWSPDGRRLFVHVGTDQLGFTDLQHGLQKLHDRPGTFQAPVWLPDGRTVYDRLDGTQQRLVVVDGDHQRALADVTGSVAFVASPDGRRIAYRVDGGTASQDGVYVRPIDGGRPTLVTQPVRPRSSGRRPATSSCCSRSSGSGADRIARWRVWSGTSCSRPIRTGRARPSASGTCPSSISTRRRSRLGRPTGARSRSPEQIDGRSGIYVQRVDGGAPTFVSDGEFVLWSPPERATSTN